VVPVAANTAKLLAKVESGEGGLDVAEGNATAIVTLESKGALDTLDTSNFEYTDLSDLSDLSIVTDTYLDYATFSEAICYNTESFPDKHPVSWEQFWDEFIHETAIVGMTEREVTYRIGELARKHGFDSLAWCDVGSGPNGASPLHHWSDRPILAGDPVVIDFAAKRDGYYMDTCRTPVAGKADREFLKIYDIVNRAHETALVKVAPGVPAEAVDRAAREVISQAGYGEHFIHRVGHGLGIDAHEAPYIVSGNTEPLREGMVFSIEPGIYIPDRWGVRIENIIAVTADAGIALNNFGRELVEMK
jgi:hypothetical protein